MGNICILYRVQQALNAPLLYRPLYAIRKWHNKVFFKTFASPTQWQEIQNTLTKQNEKYLLMLWMMNEWMTISFISFHFILLFDAAWNTHTHTHSGIYTRLSSSLNILVCYSTQQQVDDPNKRLRIQFAFNVHTRSYVSDRSRTLTHSLNNAFYAISPISHPLFYAYTGCKINVENKSVHTHQKS